MVGWARWWGAGATTRVFVHVGPHKTGTTYIQNLLMANHSRLADQGVLFPRRVFKAQARSIRELVDHPHPRDGGRPPEGEWAKLVKQIDAWRGRSVVLSHEMLSRADPGDVATVRRAFDRYDLHVVYTARDLARVVPAMWQTALRSRRRTRWDAYVAELREPAADSSRAESFWYGQDAPAVLDRWGQGLPRGNLHVVTVPPAGSRPEVLWQRFCSVLDIDPADHDLRIPRSNPSLGTAEAELLRRTNERLSRSSIDGPDWLHWTRWLGRQLETREQMSRFTLPESEIGWLSERADDIIDRLRSADYDVVGDLDDLRPRLAPAQTAPDPDQYTDTEVLDVAVDVVRRLVLELAAQESTDGAPGTVTGAGESDNE